MDEIIKIYTEIIQYIHARMAETKDISKIEAYQDISILIRDIIHEQQHLENSKSKTSNKTKEVNKNK